MCTMSNALIWTTMGMLLIAAEMLIPGFWIVFFGLSAIFVGLLNWMIPSMPAAVSMFVCAVLGTFLLYLSRKLFPGFFASDSSNTDLSDKHIDADDVVNARALVTEPITPERPGKVDFRGSSWNAEADHDIPAGEMVTVVSRTNLTLHVK